ncbi:MAG: hypothetical protein LBD25_02415 [Coriobacteriales bacterium]|nr:hypothetical protein [Coriobacteriales bacterium]
MPIQTLEDDFSFNKALKVVIDIALVLTLISMILMVLFVMTDSSTSSSSSS